MQEEEEEAEEDEVYMDLEALKNQSSVSFHFLSSFILAIYFPQPRVQLIEFPQACLARYAPPFNVKAPRARLYFPHALQSQCTVASENRTF